MSIEIKRRVHARAQEQISAKIVELEAGLEAARKQANSQQKSSAGDKHETTRAMAHLEQERYAQMLRETFSLQRQVLAVDVEEVHAEVELGALLVTTIGCFYIAAGIGEIDSEPSCWVMSPSAPLAEELEGLEVGDRFRFRRQWAEILEIY